MPPTARGQSLVILALAFVVMLLFVGIATDVGSLYFSYAQLKRALDAAAVATANEFKRNVLPEDMKKAAYEVLAMHDIDMSGGSLQVYTCDMEDLEALNKTFYDKCPHDEDPPRKLVWVEADYLAPLYFMRLLGFNDLPLHANAISEAGPIDLVLVFDTSESMGLKTPGYDPLDFDPAACNLANDCQPLKDAKDAAKILVDKVLYPGYDRVALVTFDYQAITRLSLIEGTDIANVRDNQIDALIKLHDDPPTKYLWPNWNNGGYPGLYNPVDPEDRDGDGNDADPNAPCILDEDRWDETNNVPCDADDKEDAFDWNQNGVFDESDDQRSREEIAKRNQHVIDPDTHEELPPPRLATISTCTGCGIREAAMNLTRAGRPNAVWVIVLLSDGLANLSDMPRTLPGFDADYPNGYCGGRISRTDGFDNDSNFWMSGCVDFKINERYCIDDDDTTCPPDSNWVKDPIFSLVPPYSPPYSVDDYARDMVDSAALRVSLKEQEPAGRDIAIYTIALGTAFGESGLGAETAASLLRYMANVGKDGSRLADPCATYEHQPNKNCGNYYFAPSGPALAPIFESIASRIYTRIAE